MGLFRRRAEEPIKTEKDLLSALAESEAIDWEKQCKSQHFLLVWS